MKVGLAQFSALPDKAKNLELIRGYAAHAASEGAQLLVCPELTMYDCAADLPFFDEVAESLDGEFVTSLSAIASEHQIALVVGLFESGPEPQRVYNTEIALGPDGRILATYRKLHLFDALGWQESKKVIPGEVEQGCGVVFDLGGWRFGILTCFDLRFPELARTLSEAGAEVILHPTAWTSGPVKEEHHEVFCRARAIENTCYVVSVNQCPPVCTGRSCVIDPMGIPSIGLGEDDALAVVTLDKARLASVREKLPLLNLRRVGVR